MVGGCFFFFVCDFLMVFVGCFFCWFWWLWVVCQYLLTHSQNKYVSLSFRSLEVPCND